MNLMVIMMIMTMMMLQHYTGYGYYCLSLNDIPHVWHMLVANLDDRLILITYCFTNNLNYALVSLKLLCKMVVKRDPLIKPCILLSVIYFWFTTDKSS